MKKSRKTAIVIGVILLIGIYYYVTLPAINIHSTDTWFYIAGLIVFILVFYIIRKRMRPTEIRESKPAKAMLTVLLAVGVVYLIGSILSSPIVNAKKYQKLLKVEKGNFTEDVEAFLLVAKQPDLGTGLVFLAIFLGMIFVAGISLKILGIVFGAFLAMLPIIWQFLHDYQKMRIMVFIDPNVDPLGSGYHIIQSKIAIGSGMLFGKGLFGGTQSQLNFLPENHTDFIFAVVGEEFGFIGAAFLLCLYLIVLWRGVKIARECKDAFGMLLASGITSMLAFHLLVNVGMTMGVMPVTGIPLPLMSYGVSSLLTNVTCLGLLMNIHMKQQSLHF